MDRPNLDEQLELFREGEPFVADARREVAENESAARRSKKIQAFDAVVGAAVRDVAVPIDFASRIASRLETVALAQVVRNRRYFVFGGVGSALVLSLLIGLFLWRWPDPTWTNPRVADAAAGWYSMRLTILPTDEATPKFPQIGLRESLVAGFQEGQLLKRDAAIYRLETPAGDHAVAIIVPAAWFPDSFDFSPTYTISGDAALEVRFIQFSGGDEYCILVSPNPKAFEAKTVIL